MNLKNCKVKIGLAVLSAFAIQSFALGAPSWSYPDAPSPGAQSSWSQIIDPTSSNPVPLNYPYSECGVGAKQSPIDINSANLVSQAGLNTINYRYNAEPLSILNDGDTIKVLENTTTPGKLYFGTVQSYDEYTLIQFHIHAPSEHTVNGISFPMELHFVHATPDGKLAVVAVGVVEGAFNPDLQIILDNAPMTPDSIAIHPQNITINPKNLLPENTGSYISYAGSLTTPPCTEGVNWYLMTNLIQASEGQISQFLNIHNNILNARTTNKLNGRLINLRP